MIDHNQFNFGIGQKVAKFRRTNKSMAKPIIPTQNMEEKIGTTQIPESILEVENTNNIWP
jgi:hypothetical protein